jgi:hypothetical protein
MAIFKSEPSAKIDAPNRSQAVIAFNLDGTIDKHHSLFVELRDAPASIHRSAAANTQRSREGSPAQASRQGLTGFFCLRSQQIYEVVHVDEQTDRLSIRLPASGADATHADHFGPEWAPQHNFSTSCPFMDRRLPMKCIVALRREASNQRMCRC